MSSVIISGDTSGAITLSAPAVAGTNTITLPAVTGTAVVTGTTPTLNGITFPATQVPSADANTLDDYEEGTWTATFVVDGGSVTTDATIRYGFYTKIGRQVTVTCYVKASAISSPTGSLYIFTLPFAASSTTGSTSCVSVQANNFASGATTQIIGFIATGGSYIQINRYSAGAQALLASSLTTTTEIQITATYFV